MLFALILLVGKRSKVIEQVTLLIPSWRFFGNMGSRDKVKSHRTIDLFLLLPHLSMKEGSLFVLFCFVLYCIVVMRSTEPGCFRSWSWCRLWKALDE
jgi:hypothetical protein